MSITHGDCKGHVSLYRGCCYCDRANMVYCSPALVFGLEKSSINQVDLDTFQACVQQFQRDYKLRPLAFVLLDPSVTMPGLEMDGLKPSETPPFVKEPKKERVKK